MRATSCLAVVLLLTACGSAPETVRSRASESPRAQAEPAPPRTSTGPKIVAFGDSLTAGLGVSPEQSYPARLESELRSRGYDVQVVNEGVSGDTSAVALARVDLAASLDADWALIAIGANDGLRGLPIDGMERNLSQIIERFLAQGTRVVLAGMRLPPNFGPEYVSAFESVYPRLAAAHQTPLIPFLLDGVAADPALNQDDGIHPNAAGYNVVAREVASFLEPLLAADRAR